MEGAQDLYTLDELIALRDAGRDDLSKPIRLAVLGDPIAHSKSPRMHQQALDELRIKARYIKLHVTPGRIAEAFQVMKSMQFIGANVTIPHKQEALAACDDVDPAAAEMGAVNTVVFRTKRSTHGTNTDGYGFEQAVLEKLGIKLAGKSVCVVGAGGGAGGAISVHCARAGVKKLILANRSAKKIQALAARISSNHPQVGILAAGLGDPHLAALCASTDLIVNATSLGLKKSDPSPLSPDSFRAGQYVFDSVYHPHSAFQAMARKAGSRLATGEGMLLHQGVRAFQIWFPGTEPLDAMRRGLAG
jgi:shikimate dehydrogenase